MQMVGERLGILDQFQGVDELKVNADGTPSKFWSASKAANTRFQNAPERRHCLVGPPGNLPEPKNNPQIGMMNMRTVMPALQKAKAGKARRGGSELSPMSRCQNNCAKPRL